MATNAIFLPAGYSDSEEDSDIDDFGNRYIPKIGQTSQMTGRLCVDIQSNKQTTSRAKKKKLFFEKSRFTELTETENPSLDPKNALFFQHARQNNMKIANTKQRQISHSLPKWTDITETEICASYVLSPNSAKISIVDDKDSFDVMMTVLYKAKLLALDVEGNQNHSYLGMTALIQIGTIDEDFLIDPFPLYMEIYKDLKKILEDSQKLKIIYAAENEVNWLRRDFDIEIQNMIDCQLLYMLHASMNTKPGLSLCVENVFPGFKLSKEETHCDWRRRPLTESMKVYAHLDVYTLLRVYLKLRTIVSPVVLDKAIKLSWQIITKSYSEKQYPKAFEDLKQKNKMLTKQGYKTLSLANNLNVFERFELLHQWRDRFSRMIDESPKNVLDIQHIVELANANKEMDVVTIRMFIQSKTSLPLNKYLSEQGHTIYRIFNEKYNFIVHMNNSECHNCHMIGHVAIFCPFPANKKCFKEYLKMHPEKKKEVNRKNNLSKKRNAKNRHVANMAKNL